MITILYFAGIREQLNKEQETIELPATVLTVADLKQYLIAERGEAWKQVITQPNLLVAVNQAMVTDDHSLSGGDEVAFFPPMTGG